MAMPVISGDERVARKSMKKNQIIELVWLKFDTIQQSGSNFLNLNDQEEQGLRRSQSEDRGRVQLNFIGKSFVVNGVTIFW